MYYLFRAQPDPKLVKAKEKNLPKTGKVFLLLFFLFHVAFLGFNFWYFYYNIITDADTDIAIDSVDVPAPETAE
jgi:multidrug resistance efflux pump